MVRKKTKYKILSAMYKDNQKKIGKDERTNRAWNLKRRRRISGFVLFMGAIRDDGMANHQRRKYPWPYTKTGRPSKAYLIEVAKEEISDMVDQAMGEVIDSVMEDLHSGRLGTVQVAPGMLLVVRRKKKPQPSEGGGNG